MEGSSRWEGGRVVIFDSIVIQTDLVQKSRCLTVDIDLRQPAAERRFALLQMD